MGITYQPRQLRIRRRYQRCQDNDAQQKAARVGQDLSRQTGTAQETTLTTHLSGADQEVGGSASYFTGQSSFLFVHMVAPRPLLITWLNFNPNMDK